jgi:hypothetical protein
MTPTFIITHDCDLLNDALTLQTTSGRERVLEAMSDAYEKAVICHVMVSTAFEWAHDGCAGIGDIASDLLAYGEKLVTKKDGESDLLHRMFIGIRTHSVTGWPDSRHPSAHEAAYGGAYFLFARICSILSISHPQQIENCVWPPSGNLTKSQLMDSLERHSSDLRSYLLTLPSPDRALEEWGGEFDFEYYRVMDRLLMFASQFGVGPPDEKEDGLREKFLRIPRNQDVIRLAKAIRSPKNRDRPMIDIALEIAENNETRAESLLRKLRDFRHLLEP